MAMPLSEAVFQSTPPVRGATERLPLPLPVKGISIHAPRAGGDSDITDPTARSAIFQSTPPVRGATQEAR